MFGADRLAQSFISLKFNGLRFSMLETM